MTWKVASCSNIPWTHSLLWSVETILLHSTRIHRYINSVANCPWKKLCKLYGNWRITAKIGSLAVEQYYFLRHHLNKMRSCQGHGKSHRWIFYKFCECSHDSFAGFQLCTYNKESSENKSTLEILWKRRKSEVTPWSQWSSFIHPEKKNLLQLCHGMYYIGLPRLFSG